MSNVAYMSVVKSAIVRYAKEEDGVADDASPEDVLDNLNLEFRDDGNVFSVRRETERLRFDLVIFPKSIVATVQYTVDDESLPPNFVTTLAIGGDHNGDVTEDLVFKLLVAIQELLD